MHKLLSKNVYLVKEHVGMFKAANNYDIYDPQTNEIIMECREELLGIIALPRPAPTSGKPWAQEGNRPLIELRQQRTGRGFQQAMAGWANLTTPNCLFILPVHTCFPAG